MNHSKKQLIEENKYLKMKLERSQALNQVLMSQLKTLTYELDNAKKDFKQMIASNKLELEKLKSMYDAKLFNRERQFKQELKNQEIYYLQLQEKTTKIHWDILNRQKHLMNVKSDEYEFQLSALNHLNHALIEQGRFSTNMPPINSKLTRASMRKLCAILVPIDVKGKDE